MPLTAFFIDALGVFTSALFPLSVFCAVGALADRWLGFDLRTIGRVCLYIFVPPLVFSSLMEVQVAGAEVVRVAFFAALVMSSMALLGWLYGRWCRFDGPAVSSTVLATTFSNLVNLGFPFMLFVFGERGLELAAVMVAVCMVPHTGLGMYVAARGTLNNRQALAAIARMPMLYALGLAVVFRLVGIEIPEMLFNPIKILGRAGITLVLVLVGMELGRIRLTRLPRAEWGIIGLRLLAGPLLAWGAATLVGLSGMLKIVVILQASMPTAIMPIVFAREFGTNVDLVARAAFYTTVLSMFSLPILCTLLR